MINTIKKKILILHCQYCVNVIGLPLYFRIYEIERFSKSLSIFHK